MNVEIQKGCEAYNQLDINTNQLIDKLIVIAKKMDNNKEAIDTIITETEMLVGMVDKIREKEKKALDLETNNRQKAAQLLLIIKEKHPEYLDAFSSYTERTLTFGQIEKMIEQLGCTVKTINAQIEQITETQVSKKNLDKVMDQLKEQRRQISRLMMMSTFKN
ncbi:hypothetical protein EIN_376600 [Entamoeba invadens IP1]|uniref:Uncharacterized protein n=1 Tax=Entamoeba invadens IP1 TaxID=370355 RepID=A0A0A1TU80_ENTIV|nr:hypothetical protein EIN_376600 [Entamoeba invadens IP1]ELP83485.1 hypothetical protein EIN_376600 [Entamoeba invadens IP1]|eukprot:XP_004182831.1 hypothetical protein EIN_376600 [Entamoeba invadens IP1]